VVAGFQKALEVAAVEYEGLFDKNGLPIMFHAMAVARPMMEEYGEAHAIVGLLHDAYENPWNTEEDFIGCGEIFGPEIEAAVRAVTKAESENYLEEYIPRCFANPIAKAVKVCDLQNNYGGLHNIPNPEDRVRLTAKYAAALAMAGE
jgi:(p)ppGpp synthase/HD superfamily hydrolase|tara:strand:- start:113 stop:553 length:441 start_codon:yes stop_codon:yes gene_type:complete